MLKMIESFDIRIPRDPHTRNIPLYELQRREEAKRIVEQEEMRQKLREANSYTRASGGSIATKSEVEVDWLEEPPISVVH